jgi:hypothetical protein
MVDVMMNDGVELLDHEFFGTHGAIVPTFGLVVQG